MFDPALTHHYLVQEARRSGSTLTFEEKVSHLVRKYGVLRSLAALAVNYAENP